MKKALIILVTCIALLGAMFLTFQSLSRQAWERSLYGPFSGTAFSASLSSSPASVLTIPTRGQLEVHELPLHNNPVLLMRSLSGEIQWARLLLPEKKAPDGSVSQAAVRELRLKTLEHRSDGAVVFMICDWDWGGKEGGLIALDKSYAFQSFSISW